MSLYFKPDGLTTARTSKGFFVTPYKGNVTNKRQTKNHQTSQLTLLQMRETISERHGLTLKKICLPSLFQAILLLPMQQSEAAAYTGVSQL